MYPQQQQITGTQYVPVRTNHALHLVLSVITFGFWVPVWIIMAIINSNRVKAMTTSSQITTAVAPCRIDPRPESHRDGWSWCLTHQAWHRSMDVLAA